VKIEQIGDAVLYTCDVLECLHAMPDESVNCVVTSPPYWGLRDYGTGTWEGGSAECEHDQRRRERDPESKSASNSGSSRDNIAGKEKCRKCGARRIDHQLGLEPTPEAYVARMVEVFREARRVLRRDGTCWANWGDSYNAAGRDGHGTRIGYKQGTNRASAEGDDHNRPTAPGLKHKDLCGIPWRMAFALQADGWYLRSDIIWAKPNPMPESMTDRPTKSHEYLFLLSREPRYFYDAEAIREEGVWPGQNRNVDGEDLSHMPGAPRHTGLHLKSKKPDGLDTGPGGHGTVHRAGRQAGEASEIRYGRNRRTVWHIATQPFPEAHFATFPEKLVEPCVLAGCPAQTCPECGAPWERVVEREYKGSAGVDYKDNGSGRGERSHTGGGSWAAWKADHPDRDRGFRPTCACAREDTVPGTLLDPFCGSGTALLVALRLGRRAVGIELKPEYMDMTRKRIGEEAAQGKLRDIHAQPRLPLEEPEKVRQQELEDA